MKLAFISYNDSGELTSFKESPEVFYRLMNNILENPDDKPDVEFTDLVIYDETIYDVDFDMDRQPYVTDLRTDEDVTSQIAQLNPLELCWIPVDIERLLYIIQKQGTKKN